MASLAAVPAGACQERAADGQVYRELLPFVGLEGVSVEILGLGGGIFNVPGAGADPEAAVTGLSRAQHEDLERAVRADLDAAFRDGSIPQLTLPRSDRDARPVLRLEIHWSRIRPDFFTVQVRIELREAAQLLKDASRIVSAPTWAETYNSVASGPDNLAQVVRSVVHGEIAQFVRLYVRAHATTGGPLRSGIFTSRSRMSLLADAGTACRHPRGTCSRVQRADGRVTADECHLSRRRRPSRLFRAAGAVLAFGPSRRAV